MEKNRIRTGDLLWAAAFLCCVSIFIFPVSKEIFLRATQSHAWLCGFLKFFVLATMGDLLGLRISNGQWKIPSGIFFKACLWGILGIAITFAMPLYSGGIADMMSSGIVPFEGSFLALAFFSSSAMNLTFGPMLYVYHQFGALFIDAKCENRKQKNHLSSLVERIDWKTMVCFSWAKTCPLMWIPLHTIVFLTPPQYRVVLSAFFSVLLGALIAIAGKKRAG